MKQHEQKGAKTNTDSGELMSQHFFVIPALVACGAAGGGELVWSPQATRRGENLSLFHGGDVYMNLRKGSETLCL